jgi:hypothetical protein
MILTPHQAAAAIRQHGLPDLFVQVVLAEHKRLGHGISIYFERPWEFYRLLRETPEDIPYPESIIPLHESNGDHFWCFVPDPAGLFLEHSIEWRPDDHRVVARSVAEFVDYEVGRLCEYGAELEEIRRIGTLLGHPEIEEVIRKIEDTA